MYFSKFNFFHGIMFHHFHDGKVHKSGQGSISEKDFLEIIKFIGKENILDADDFYFRLLNNKLGANHVCLTFDDGIKSQSDIVLPILDKLKIKSFFFVYSSLFSGEPDLLEVYRYFRINFYEDINNFYNAFFNLIEDNLETFFEDSNKIIKDKKIKFPHYSINDIKFRLIRDKYLSHNQYKDIMFQMFNDHDFNPEDHYDNLFMSTEDLITIDSNGHTIGLHSHSHPTLLEELSYNNQLSEYSKNISILSKILRKDKSDFKSMSHPCGSYNEDTKKVLRDFDIRLGFKQIMTVEREKKMKKINNSFLEIARQDHADIVSMMRR